MLGNINKILKSKKGLTLIEIVVVSALIGIISIPLMQILFTGQKTFNQNRMVLDYKTIALAISDTIKDEIQFATSLRIANDTNKDECKIGVEKKDGYDEVILWRPNKEKRVLFSKDFLNKRKIELSFTTTEDNKQVVRITVLVDETYKIETSVRINNLGSGEITPATSNTLIFTQ